MAYDDYKAGCSVIKEYADNLNKETAGKIPTKVSELTNDSNYATESYVNTAIGNIAQPSSLPQTYKKKAVTLATNGWVADNNLPLSLPIVCPANTFTRINGDFSEYRKITDKSKWNCSYTITVSPGDVRSFNWSAAYKIGTISNYLSVWFGDDVGSSAYYFVSVEIYDDHITINPKNNINLITLGAGASLQKQSYTDADVKVNSEVRFTLDEANGKIAGQFGLKKTIDKEAGKLTFTAGTLPTSAISGTLEIGETSTEGAAFVEGISSETDTTGFVKATEENTFTAKQTFQDVQINGNLTAKGTTTTVDVKNLDVEQQLITVAKGNTAALTSPAGLKAEKYDGTKDGALVFDASGMAMVGDVVLDANGNIDAAQSDLQDLATRAKPSELTDGHLLKWDATNKKIVDGGAISSGGVKTDVENTFTATQTFNGTESQAGIKTNAIDNENGDRVVYFNGTKQMFGSGAIPTQVRSSEQRLKLERPVSGGTGTEIVEIANVSDIGTGGVVIKRKNFTAKVSDGTLLLDNKANIVLTASKNWTTVERVRATNKKFISPFSLGLDLQVGEGYTLKVGETTYTATCGFFTASYVATGETDLVTFGTGGQAKMLEFTIGARKLRIVDCAVPYGYDEIASPDVAYDGGQVKESVAAMAFWDDLSSTAISGELTLKTSTYGDVRITDADITSESFVWFKTEGTYAYASSGSAKFYYAVDANNSQIKTVTYDIITGMGAGADCEQQTLPKVKNVLIAPSGWTENKIENPTQGSIPATYYTKPALIFKDTAGVTAAETAGIEVYQTQVNYTKFGIKRTSENSTIWAAVKLD